MKNAPMKHIADQLATHGRYGDTMLVHMNPHEVAGIASLVPGGKLTTNPVTGQPEAFLPFLAPLLGGWLGSAAAGAGLLGGLGTVAGSALGSGLATTIATGDLEQGLISGITGFGLGSALSGLGGAAGTAGTAVPTTVAPAATSVAPAATQAATQATQGAVGATQGAVGAGQGIQSLTPDAGFGGLSAGQMSQISPYSTDKFVADALGTDVYDLYDPYYAELTKNFTPEDYTSLSKIDPNYFSSGAAAKDLIPKPTFTEGLMAPFRNSDQFLTNLSNPKNLLPMYIGEGTNAGIRAQKMNEEAMSRYKREQEAEGSAARQGILRALERVRTDYGMFGGGQVDYATGGSITGTGGSIKSIINAAKNKEDPADAAIAKSVEDFYGAYGGPSGLQSSLRGPVLNTPPAFDYNALYSGGSGYAPGISPEFMFFSQRPTDAGGGTGSSGGTGLPGGTPGTGVPGGTPNPLPNPGIRPGPINLPFRNEPMMAIAPASSQTDIQSFLDLYTPTENEYLREARMFAEGGEVEPTMAGLDMVEGADPIAPANPIRAEYDNLVKMTIAAIQGQVENPEAIIQQFVAEYGNEAFLQLRESVLQNVQPGAQTQGLVDGYGGGMDDMVQGSISDGRPVAVSPGEYIIPADVVSSAGDGNTNSGAKYFDDLIESIRVNKTGTSEQPKPMKDIMG